VAASYLASVAAAVPSSSSQSTAGSQAARDGSNVSVLPRSTLGDDGVPVSSAPPLETAMTKQASLASFAAESSEMRTIRDVHRECIRMEAVRLEAFKYWFLSIPVALTTLLFIPPNTPKLARLSPFFAICIAGAYADNYYTKQRCEHGQPRFEEAYRLHLEKQAQDPTHPDTRREQAVENAIAGRKT